MTKQEYATRRDATAWIFTNERPETIARIMEGKGMVCPMLAGRLYVNGILSRMVRTGETRNRIDALEKLEASQVESRYTTAPTINKTARAVARPGKATRGQTDRDRGVSGQRQRENFLHKRGDVRLRGGGSGAKTDRRMVCVHLRPAREGKTLGKRG